MRETDPSVHSSFMPEQPETFVFVLWVKAGQELPSLSYSSVVCFHDDCPSAQQQSEGDPVRLLCLHRMVDGDVGR